MPPPTPSPTSTAALLGALLGAFHVVLHVGLAVRPDVAAPGDTPAHVIAHVLLGAAAVGVFLRFPTALALGALAFVALAFAAGTVLRQQGGPGVLGPYATARAVSATVIAVVALWLVAARARGGQTSRRNPFRIDPRSEPQRLLALSALRRRLITHVLGLSGPEADAAAFDLAARLRARLDATSDADPPELRQTLLAGLLVTGDATTIAPLAAAVEQGLAAVTLEALGLVMPIPPKMLAVANGNEIGRWLATRGPKLGWDATAERYTF